MRKLRITVNKISAIMGVRSNMPSGGMTRRNGPRIGSVILCRTSLLV